MGNAQSLGMFDPAHVRIYGNILKLANPATRVQMIETLLAGQEYVAAAKHAGVYAALLAYVTYYRRGVMPPALPGEVGYTGGQMATANFGRQDQSVYQVAGGAGGPGMAVHPSLMGSAQAQAQQQRQAQTQHQHQIQQYQETPTNPWQVVKAPEKKALDYFNSCLEILGLSEDMTLTEEILKSAYRKAAARAHPDRAGGSEEKFEVVTRAYAYVSQILKRVAGKRTGDGTGVAPQTLEPVRDQREAEMERFKHVEPVRLNPKNLNLNAFNQMFEQTKLPDPDDDGYGDWLKSEEGAKGPAFSGKFNRDVFNRAFEEDSRRSAQQQQSALTVVHPQAMALTVGVGHGVELGRDKPQSFTAPANASVKYTDLRDAYTKENTFSGQVAGVQVEQRSFESYKTQREAGPGTVSAAEMAALQAQEQEFTARETARQRRAADQTRTEDEYFKRMKQLVLMNN